MQRQPIWSVKSHALFQSLSLLLYGIGLYLWDWNKPNLNIVESLMTIGVFSVTTTFFILAAWDAIIMGPITQLVKQRIERKAQEKAQRATQKEFLDFIQSNQHDGVVEVQKLVSFFDRTK